MSLRRWESVAALGGAVASSPVLVRGQQPRMPVVGLLSGVHTDLVSDEFFHVCF
jgi:hypothetical protein